MTQPIRNSVLKWKSYGDLILLLIVTLLKVNFRSECVTCYNFPPEIFGKHYILIGSIKLKKVVMMYNFVGLYIAFLEDLWNSFVNLLPGTIGAIVALIIGWIAGRALGKGVSKVLDKAGVDDALRKTVIGKSIEKSGITCVHFFDLVVRWFVYLIAILAAASILNIAVLSEFLNNVVSYIPSFIAGVFILIFGFIIVDYFADFFRTIGREAKIEFTGIIVTGLRLLLYFVVIVIALSVIGIDVTILYIFATALAWGVAIGAGAGIAIAFGWGFKDVVRKKADEWVKRASEAARKVDEITEQ